MTTKWILFFPVALVGCMVGPNYRPPVTCVPNTFSESVPEASCEMTNGDFFEWWRRFDDELLNELLEETARLNYDLRLAEEKVCQARAVFGVQFANQFPEIDLETFATRSRNSQNLGTLTSLLGPRFQNFFLFGFSMAWDLDLFGGLRRAKRSAFFAWQSADEMARSTQILVLSQVAVQYTIIRALQKKVELAIETVRFDDEELALAEQKFQSGLNNEIDVLNLRETLSNDVAFLTNLESLLRQGIYSLATLIGSPPESLLCRFDLPGSIPNALGKVPAYLPSQLLCRRPDIRAAERSLASATEDIGVAVASLFPQVSLTSSNLFSSRLTSSNYGWASSRLSNLFSGLSKTWSFGLATFLPILDFGRNIGQVRIENSLQRQALITYEKTVTSALQEVEIALTAYFEEEQRQTFLIEVAASTKRAEQLTADQYQAGLVDYSQVLDARKKWLAAENTLTDSQQALSSNLIAVYKSLGGDWACFYTP